METWRGTWTPLNYEGFEQYLIKEGTHPGYGGFTYEFVFKDRLIVSVIKHDCSYGNVDDLFEIAILVDDVVEEVIGWKTNDEVLKLLNEIRGHYE